MIDVLFYVLVVFFRVVWDCMECSIYINEFGRNSRVNRYYFVGYKVGLEVLYLNRRYCMIIFGILIIFYSCDLFFRFGNCMYELF